ncbi:MAG: O-antigen ligase family protein [Marinilabiliaceae bacterium]|nr:O-antigen ligase family protein [Marinilabiliaceae bacterium]
MLKVLKAIPLLIVPLLCLGSSFVIDHKLMQGVILPKWLWVQLMAIPTLLFIVVGVFLKKTRIIFTKADIVLIALVIWLIVRASVNAHLNEVMVLKVLAGVMIWLFIRLFFSSQEVIKATLFIYMAVIASQCILGLLQLYGFLGSHHSLFPITGTFHNPGPFSGFVVSGLPMALGVYFVTRKKRITQRAQRGNNKEEFHGEEEKGLFSVSIGGGKVTTWSSIMNGWISGLITWVKQLTGDVCLHYFSQVVIVLLLLVLPAARSRAAWLAGAIGCAYVFWFFRKELKTSLRADNYRDFASALRIFALPKKLLVFIGLLVFLASFIGLYKFKQGSADGRLLMWQVSWEMIKDKPVMGWGSGGFEAHYGDYQAGWFRSGKGTSAQELVAGTPDAPFNELIRIWVEYGVVGVFLVLGILYFCFAKLRRESQRDTKKSLRGFVFPSCPDIYRGFAILQGSLLSILVFSLFSYPLDVAPIVVQIIVLIALITNLQSATYGLSPKTYNLNPIISKLAALVLLALIPYIAHQTLNQYKGHKHWKEAYQLYQYQIYDDAAEEYEKALQYLPANGLLLQVYGKCLAMDEKWEQAKEELSEASNFRSDPILYTTLGDTYKALHTYDQAEKAYWHAWQMVPHKFYPKYLLVKLYDENGENEKARNLASELIGKEVKVESVAIGEMKNELMRLLQK